MKPKSTQSGRLVGTVWRRISNGQMYIVTDHVGPDVVIKPINQTGPAKKRWKWIGTLLHNYRKVG